MRTFEFRMTDDTLSETVTIQFEGTDFNVDDMLYKFMKFLRAADYCFGLDDQLELVSGEERWERKIE